MLCLKGKSNSQSERNAQKMSRYTKDGEETIRNISGRKGKIVSLDVDEFINENVSRQLIQKSRLKQFVDY